MGTCPAAGARESGKLNASSSVRNIVANRATRRLTFWWFTLVTSQFLRVLWALSAWAGGPAGRGNFTAFGTDEPLDFLSKFVFDVPE